jgi:hypothetical protein
MCVEGSASEVIKSGFRLMQHLAGAAARSCPLSALAVVSTLLLTLARAAFWLVVDTASS